MNKYGIKQNVYIKDLSDETKNFLLEMGFKEDENLSESFEIFLKKKGIELTDHKFDL